MQLLKSCLLYFVLHCKASEFCKGYGNRGKSSGEKKFHGLVATRGSTMVEKNFDFGRSTVSDKSYAKSCYLNNLVFLLASPSNNVEKQ